MEKRFAVEADWIAIRKALQIQNRGDKGFTHTPQNGVLLRNKTDVKGTAHYAIVKAEPTSKDSKQLPKIQKQ